MPIEEAVECTITECIREGILEEFLRKYQAEAKRMSIYEYDQARHIRQEREEAWEEGRQWSRLLRQWKRRLLWWRSGWLILTDE